MYYCEICGDWMDCWNDCENCDIWKDWMSKTINERSDLILKEKTTNKNCPYCRYDNIVAFVMKHTTINRPVEEYIPVNFCPKCGVNLALAEYLNDS